MGKRMIWAMPGGSIYLALPGLAHLTKRMAAGLSEDQVLDELMTKWEQDRPDLAAATRLVHAEASSFPDAYWGRDAWSPNSGAVILDMAKARAIHTDRIALAKRKIARGLIEREVLGENVTAEKTALAAINMQPQIDAAATPEALKAIWPVLLPRSPT